MATANTQTTVLIGTATNDDNGQPSPSTWTSTVRLIIDGEVTRTDPLDTATQLPSSGSADSSDITAASATAIESTSSPSETSAAPSDNGASGHSTGALAGAAVGCAIGGILIGLVAAWLLFRRRRKGENDRKAVPLERTREYVPVNKGSPTVSDNSTPMNHLLLDATPDREIEAELQSLGHLIDQHVDQHYHLDPVTDLRTLSRDLALLGDFFHGTEAIAAVCAKPESRFTGLRHVISQVIFKSLDIHSRHQLSMLPTAVSTFLDSVPPANAKAQSAAISEWRRLSAFLLHPSPYNRDPLPVSEAGVSPQARAVTDRLNVFLHHFVGTSLGEQANHLQAVIIECTKLGYVILSQPQDWRFVFDKGDAVAVCPGLDKAERRVMEPEVGPVGA